MGGTNWGHPLDTILFFAACRMVALSFGHAPLFGAVLTAAVYDNKRNAFMDKSS